MTARREPVFTPDTLAAWERNSLMNVTGPSGTKFTILSLTLDDLAAEDALPDDLLRVAMIEAHVDGGLSGEITDLIRKGDKKSLDQMRALSKATLELRDRIVRRALVKPAVRTAAALAKLDPYDKHMIAAISQRQANRDATGKRVGADTLDTFREACALLSLSETNETRKGLLVELSQVQ